MDKKWCCEDMQNCVEAYLECDDKHKHLDSFDCDLTLIHRNQSDKFGLIYHSDDSEGGINPIRFCPFCGQNLEKFYCTQKGDSIQ